MRTAVTDPKTTALAAARSLNRHPEKVTDRAFLSSEFCDPRDAVQVKYEMVRRVRVDHLPVASAARAFGFCRQAYYQIAATLDAGGPAALAGAKPGPKGARKLTEPVMARVEAWITEDPRRKARALAVLVEAEFGFVVHPRSIERAIGRRAREPEEPKTRS